MGATFRTDWDTEANPAYDIWTSVNGSEILPGVVSPFTASVLNRYDYECLRRLMLSYEGGHKTQLFPPPIGNFFGVAGGRLVLNNGFSVAALSALDPEIAQAILQQFFTGASGGERFIVESTPEELASAYAEATFQREAAPAILEGHRAALYAERASGRYSRDLELDLATAWERFEDLGVDTYVRILPLHYVVSVAAGEFQVRLAGVIAAGGGNPDLMVPLCSALGDVESSKPAMALHDLAVLARQQPEVRSVLESGDLESAMDHLADTDGPWAELARAFEQFRFLYGYRGQGEADPTNPDWAETPVFALSQVRAMMDMPDEDAPRTTAARAAERREALEREVRASLSEEVRPLFDDVLDKAQRYTRMRELSKATWVLACRRLRAPYLAIARRLAEAGVLEQADDARFLLDREIAAIVAGEALPDARERVSRRRQQAEEAARYSLPDNWVGEPELTQVTAAEGATELTGLGVSGGDGPVTGTARIIMSAEAGLARDLDPGDILVAPFTDAPWTPLFVVAGAVVVETGGVLSHAATVAREFGIPAVVMVKDATRVIPDGATVTVDGATGTVTVSDRSPVTAD